MSSEYDPAANRRRFLQYLAASPLMAAGSASALAETLLPKTMVPDPLMWGPRQSDHLIKSPKEAINVFDLEPVCRQNVPPAHFGYMASGIDDEVTLRANREGFLKFQFRPRRLVDVSKVDMSVDILGTHYPSPIVVRADRRPEAHFTPKAKSRLARAAKAGNHLQILSTRHRTPSRTSPKRAARRSGISSTPPTSGRSPRPPSPRAPKRPDARRGGHRRSQRRTQPGNAARLRPSDTRDCYGCHDRSSFQANLKTPGDVPGSGHHRVSRNTQSSNMTWDFFKRMRDHTKMKILAKGILAWEDAVLAADARPRRHHRVQPRRALGGFRALDHRRAAGDRRGGEGPHPDPGGFGLPPRLRRGEGLVHGRDRGLRRPALYLGPRRLRPGRRRARFGASPHRNPRYDATGWRAER